MGPQIRMSRLKKLLAEPLLHFLVLGAALFGVYALLDRRQHAERPGTVESVRITEADIAWLRETWVRQWQREPSDRELSGLLADYLKEEVLSREARALGLDRDDVIVRRRLAQKMTFLVEDTAQFAEPADEDLRRTYDADPDRFQEPARITFAHVYFNRDRRGPAAAEDAKRALGELSGDGTPPDLSVIGDRSLVPGAFASTDCREVAEQFGPAFAKEVFALPVGGWHGPLESGFGLHLVRVEESSPPKQRSFDAVRADILQEWRQERRVEAQDRYFADLLRKYDVVVAESVKPLLASVAEPGK